MDLPTPIHVFSDLHLGHPASHLVEPEWLFPALEGARSVVLNGDSSELINNSRKVVATQKLNRLLDRCRELGIACVQLTGNHDPFVTEFHHLDLLDGKVFITHGDALHPDVAPWSREAVDLRAERLRIEATEDPPDATTLEGRLLLAKRCALVVGTEDPYGEHQKWARLNMTSLFALEPWRALRAIHYWSNVFQYASAMRAQFRPNSQLMLIGHSHRPAVWRMPDWTLVNTGSFQPMSSPRMVKLQPDRATVHRLKKSEGAFRPTEPVAVIPLSSAGNP